MIQPHMQLPVMVFESAGKSFMERAGKWRLQVSIPKTKGLEVSEELQHSYRLPVQRWRVDHWEMVDSFN